MALSIRSFPSTLNPYVAPRKSGGQRRVVRMSAEGAFAYMSSLNVERGLNNDHVLEAFAQGWIPTVHCNTTRKPRIKQLIRRVRGRTWERRCTVETNLHMYRRCHFFVRFSDQRR